MTARIGVRDLKNRASEIVREIHEKQAEYIITLRGEPVAVLRPLRKDDEQAQLQAETDEAFAKMDSLAERITRAWRSPKSPLELLEEQRR
jgi:prevent-host-death family protein